MLDIVWLWFCVAIGVIFELLGAGFGVALVISGRIEGLLLSISCFAECLITVAYNYKFTITANRRRKLWDKYYSTPIEDFDSLKSILDQIDETLS